ncbi:F-box-like/WD repeat-containing protein TBL1Y [Mycena venus]|uniref:F-box-like/WD repeat-containing protein TBL1Y n=1 Tax=Mycena venus TaxID=2733690 RepID=A0A8H6XSN1_9AGAR|nr:F-box-like/WD repeat-containing protein TBL1Y [Mycena venus]
MADNIPVIHMTADEINCLVYAFLVDSGFKHTAFSFCMEGRLENSPNFSKHIPRGELVDLLGKSLLYREVESHWKADHLALNCKAGFSLLEPHVCSLEPPKLKSVPFPLTYTQRPLGQSNRINTVSDSGGKRKASPASGAEGPAEKRPRHNSDDMDTDLYRAPDSSGKKPKPKPPRQQGPGDNETNPNAILTLAGHETEVFVCAFNPAKPSILVTGSKDAVVNLWDLPNPPLPGTSEFAQPPGAPRRLEHFGNSDQGDLTALHWNAEGTLIAIGSYDTVLRVCTASGDLYFQHTQHQGPIFAVRFSKDGKWLLTASLDSTACLWDVNAKELKMQYRAHTDCCLDVDWLSDTLFGSCSADQLIHIMQVGKAEPVKTLSGHTNEINQIKCNPSGTRLASCSDDMTARIWKIDGLSTSGDSIPGLGGSEQPIVLGGHQHSVSTIGWCPDHPAGTNEIIATSSFDGTARLWDSVTGECLKMFSDHKRPVYALKFSPTGRWVATGSGDGWLHIYDVKEREMKWSWFAGYEKPGVFEIDWQTSENLDRIALALECRNVAVIDVSRIPALQRK